MKYVEIVLSDLKEKKITLIMNWFYISLIRITQAKSPRVNFT